MVRLSSFKSKILDFAISGKLTKQLNNDGNAENLYFELLNEKEKLVKSKVIRKEEQLPEVSDEELPFDIPKNWKWVRLNDLCFSITDGTHKTPNYVEKGIPFLSVKNISSGVFELDDIKYISKNEHNKLIQRCKPEKNDILICRIGTLGKAIKINIDLEFSIFVSLGLLKLLNISMADYIVNVLNSKYCHNWIEKNKAGGAMHTFKINLESLRMIPIPLPPINEQKRINEEISKINFIFNNIEKNQEKYYKDYSVLCKKIIEAGISGQLTEQLDSDGKAENLYNDIINEKEKLIKSGKLKKEEIFPIVSTDEYPFSLPKNWKFVRVGNIFSVKGGKRIPVGEKLVDYNTGHIFIRVTDMKNGSINTNDLKFITDKIYRKIKQYTISKDDIYLTVAGSIGKVGFVPDELDNANLTENADKIIIYKCNKKFVYYCFLSRFLQLQINNSITSVSQPKLAIKRIENFVFPLPPLAEQKRIVEKIEVLLEK